MTAVRDGSPSDVLVIFDLDGTLVDSEGLCNQAFVDLLSQLRYTVVQLTEMFRGRKLDDILSVLAAEVSVTLDDAFVARYRARVAELFASALEPQPGSAALLAALEEQGVEFCIASSAPRSKIDKALRATDLDRFFSPDRIYSSYEVRSWKPDPGLLVHVATDRGYALHTCVVVEDSPIGIDAAEAAGMRSVVYNPGSEALIEHDGSEITRLEELLRVLGR